MRIARAVTFVIERTGLRARLQEMWRRDIDRSVASAHRRADKTLEKLRRLFDERKPLRQTAEVGARNVEERLAASNAAVRNLEWRVAELERTALADSRQATQVAEWSSRFSPAGICAHVARAVSEAPLGQDPAAHLVVGPLFPPEFYDLLLAALPEVDHFKRNGSNQLQLLPTEFGVVPRLTALLWEFVDTDVARAVASAALPRLRPFLEARYATLIGREWAGAVLGLPHVPSAGRLSIRRRGDREKPHLDPKRTSISVLVNLAKPGEPESGGTSLYAIDGDFAPVHTNTAYPEAHGLSCRPVSRVPFRPNTALILVNAGGAHGADVPDTLPSDFVLYAFEFAIGPDTQQLLDVVATLPPSAQQQWLGLAMPAK